MERYDAGQRVTIDELISSAETGGEVELTREGKVAARVVLTAGSTHLPPGPKPKWLADLEKLHARLPQSFPRSGWLEALREARDEDPF